MLTAIELKHFKNIGDQRVELGPLNVLVGRNGTGKSNFIEALRFVRDCLTRGLDSALGGSWAGLKWIRQWSAPVGAPVRISVEGRGHEGGWRYEIELTSAEAETIIAAESLSTSAGADDALRPVISVRDGEWLKRPEGLDPDLSRSNLVLPLVGRRGPFRDAFRTIADTHFYVRTPPWALSFPDTAKPPQHDEIGAFLASTLREIRDERPEAFAELTRCICNITENTDKLQVREQEGQLVIEFHHPCPIPSWRNAAHESAGTLRALGLLAARFQTPEPSLIAFEEPELNLHPGAMGLLADTFKEASLGTQIILTTHSPDLISRFEVDNLLAVESVAGEAHIGPIDDTQRQAIEDQLFSAGDLLRLDGGLRRETAAGRAQ